MPPGVAAWALALALYDSIGFKLVDGLISLSLGLS